MHTFIYKYIYTYIYKYIYIYTHLPPPPLTPPSCTYTTSLAMQRAGASEVKVAVECNVVSDGADVSISDADFGSGVVVVVADSNFVCG